MRVTTALNRRLALPGASVTGVRLTPEAVIAKLRLRRRRIACSVCGQAYLGMHDRQLRRGGIWTWPGRTSPPKRRRR